MTKEELYKEFYDWDQEEEIVGYLNYFFESNVCIPKGENRNPYADVWHKAIEDQSLTVESLMDGIEWNFKYGGAVRIKPSKPVYEYLFYDEEGYTTWRTDEEINNVDGMWFCATETKRERKQ